LKINQKQEARFKTEEIKFWWYRLYAIKFDEKRNTQENDENKKNKPLQLYEYNLAVM
jgi:hypothetical protein